MKYRHTKTGAIIDVQSEMSGAWELLETPKALDVKPEIKEAPAQKKRAKK